MRRSFEAARHCAQCPTIGTTCRTYTHFSCPVSPFRHHRTQSNAIRRAPAHTKRFVEVQSAVWKSTFSPASSTLLGAGSIGMVFMYSVNFSQKSSITKPIV